MTPFTKHAKVPIADAFSNDVPHYYTSLYSTSHHLTTHDRQKYPQPRLPRNPCTKLIQIMTSVSEKDKTRAVRVVCRLLVLLLLLLLLALRWPTRSSFLLLDARQQPNERPHVTHTVHSLTVALCMFCVPDFKEISERRRGDVETTDDGRPTTAAKGVEGSVCCVLCVVLCCVVVFVFAFVLVCWFVFGPGWFSSVEVGAIQAIPAVHAIPAIPATLRAVSKRDGLWCVATHISARMA